MRKTLITITSVVLVLAGLLAGCMSLSEPSSTEPGDGPRATQEAGESEAPAESSGPKIGEKVKYDDGVEMEITKVKVAKAPRIAILSGGDEDAEIKKGDPYYAITVRVTNGSKATIELGLVPYVSYGPDGEEAPQVLGEGAAGALNGKLVKGKAKSETFGFVIPKKHAGDVQIELHPSYEYDSMVFTGSLA